MERTETTKERKEKNQRVLFYDYCFGKVPAFPQLKVFNTGKTN